ncbi:hypothetical protein JW877_08575, partial [bacterium]|nr:hypothetical protein [bacterium]
MMKKHVVFLLLLLFAAASYADTFISGDIFGILAVSGSPYFVTDTIYVRNGDTLIIEAGVEIIFQGHFPFHVLDSSYLWASGTAEAPIRFYSDDTVSGWSGIRLFQADSNSTLNHCIMEWGRATGDWPDCCGGGIYIERTRAKVANCIFRNNTANYGGAIYMFLAVPLIEGNIIMNNHANNRAGGLGIDNSSPVITNNVICDNSSDYDGGGVLWWAFRGAFANNTVCNNTASTYGGGISAGNILYIMLFNCIIQGNSAGTYGNQIGTGLTDTIFVAYSTLDISDCFGFVIADCGVSDDLVLFNHTPDYPYLPDSLSPGIDIGAESIYVAPRDTILYAPSLDLRRYIRPWNGYYDRGAYEFGSEYVTVTEYNQKPGEYILLAYPNPFNSSTVIEIGLGNILNSNFHDGIPADISIRDLS